MGRHPTGKIPAQQLQIISGRHKEIMRREIAGEKPRVIAREMGMSEARLSVIRNSPLYQREYARLEAEVKGRFIEVQANIQEKVNELQPFAMSILEKILKEKDVDGMKVSLALKKDTALDVLEIGGNSGKSKQGNSAIDDVIQVITQGFELAKQAVDTARQNSNNNSSGDNHNESIINVTPAESEFQEELAEAI
jgi:hypothetical protein